jgi:predicted amidohydrolase
VDSAILQGYAQKHSMAVLMANHAGLTGGWQSAGRSAVWSEDGTLVAAAPGPVNCWSLRDVMPAHGTGGRSGGEAMTFELRRAELADRVFARS